MSVETLDQRAKRLRMTPLDLAYLEWEKASEDVNSPFYAMDPEGFARTVREQTGDSRYQLLEANKLTRGVQLAGNFFDSEFVNTGVAQKVGHAARGMAGWFTDNPLAIDATQAAGEELPGSIASLAPLALAGIVSGGTALAGAVGLTSLDAFTDSRESGRGVGSSLGAAGLAGASVGLMPATGRFFEQMGVNIAVRMGGSATSAAANSLRSGIANTAIKTVVRETGQIATGVGFDVADVAVFDPNRTLEDLTKAEYLIPMLLSNGVTVLGQEAITHGSQALRNRLSKTPPPLGSETPEQITTRLNNERRSQLLWDADVAAAGDLMRNTRPPEIDVNSPHGRLESLYNETYWNHYGTDSDTATAYFHSVANATDAQAMMVGAPPATTPGDFINRMVTASGQKSMPISQMLSYNQGAFNAIRQVSKSDAEAFTRMSRIVNDDARRTYNEIPDSLRENIDAGKVYNLHKEQIRRGKAEIIYADKTSGVTAVLVEPALGQNGRIKLFKGTRALPESEQIRLMPEHQDGIRIGLEEYTSTINGLRQSIQMENGFRAGASIDPGMASLVKETLTGLGVKTPVYLIGDGDLNSPELSRFKGHFNDPRKYGSMIEIDDGQGPMAIVWTKGGQGKAGIASVMHEVGHVVERSIAKQFPNAIEVLKQQADAAFGNLDMTKVENLRRFGPAHPEFLREVKKSGKALTYDFPEYFANQFSKWAIDPQAKPVSVVERYVKAVVDALRQVWERFRGKANGIAPSVEFKTWMDHMARNFYTNLMWNDDRVFRNLATKYQMGDTGTDALGRALYTNSDPMFQLLVSERLAKWHANGRVTKPEAIIGQAVNDFDGLRNVAQPLPQTIAEVKPVHVKEVAFDPQRLGVDQATLTKLLGMVKAMDTATSWVDPTEAGGVIRTIMQRWVAGELPTQKGKPKAGGNQLLENTVQRELNKLGNGTPDVMTLKTDGEVDNHSGKIKYYDNIEEAQLDAEGYANLAKYEMWQIEPQSVKLKGGGHKWKLAFKYSPDARKVQFDEAYHNSEMDSDVASTVDEARKWSVDELMMATPDVMQPAVSRMANGEVPETTAMEMAQLGLNIPTEFASRMSTAIAQAVGQRQAPESLIRALDDVVKASTDPTFVQDMRAVGREFGYTGDSIDGFIRQFVDQLANGKSYKQLALLSPEPLARAMREVGGLVDTYGKLVEYGARVGSLLGTHEQSLEQLKGARARGLELLTTDAATEKLATILKESSEGGANERLVRMQHQPSNIRKLYEATVNGFVHMAAANPQLHPFAEATSMEKRDQFRMTNDVMIPLHAADPNSLRPVFEKDRAYVVVKSDPKLNAAFDDMVRLEQLEGKGVAQLQQEGNPELAAILQTVPADKLPKFMELRERMYRVQEQNVQLRAAETRQLDRINLSTYLVRSMPTMAPKQAQVFVDTVYNTEPAKQMQVLTEAGINAEDAARFMKYKNDMDATTTAMIQRLQANPWYVSEQRMGKFLVRYYDKQNSKQGAASFATREQAQEWITEMGSTISTRRGIEDTSLKYGSRMTNDFREVLDSTIKAKQATISEMFGADEQLAQSMSSVLDDLFQSVDSASVAATKGTLGINRTFAAGRETLDMLDQQRESIRRSTVGLTRARTNAVYNLYSLDQFFQTPEGTRQLGLAKQHLKNFREPDTEAGMAAAKFSFMWTLGTNVSSIVQEVASLPLVLAPMAREQGAGFVESFTLPKKIATELASAYITNDGVFKNKEWNAIVERAKRENALTARHLVDIDEQHILNDIGTRRIIDGGKAMRAVGSLAEAAYSVGTKLYQPAATVSGTVSILTGYELSKKSYPNRTPDEHYAAAINFHELSQGAHGKAGRPVGLFSTSGPARTLSQVAFTLQSFANAQIGNIVRWGKKGFVDDGQFTPVERANARKAFAQATALTIGSVGLTGLPLVGALSKLAEKTLGYNPEHELEEFMMKYLPGDQAENAFMTNLALRGGTYTAGLPFDLQSRMMVGGLFALNNYDGLNWGNVFGVPGSFMQESMEALGGFARGQGPAEFMDMAPAGLKRAMQLWVNDGKFVKNGEVLLEPTAMEKAFSVMGFAPARLKQGYDLHGAKEYFTKKEQSARNAAADRAVDLILEGRVNEARAFIDQKADELKGLRTVQDAKSMINNEAARRFANMQTPTARDPGVTDQAPMLNALYGSGPSVSATKRYMLELQGKALLGAPVKVSRTRMQQANLTDQLQTMDPSLSPVLAGTFARLQRAGVYSNPLVDGSR